MTADIACDLSDRPALVQHELYGLLPVLISERATSRTHPETSSGPRQPAPCPPNRGRSNYIHRRPGRVISKAIQQLRAAGLNVTFTDTTTAVVT